VIYLHGQIIEEQGINAHSTLFGKYAFEEIIDFLRNTPATVYADVHDSNVHFVHYCQQISNRIDSLILTGIRPNQITVLGASKGGVMAMIISNMNETPINYIFLGSNNITIEQENDWSFNGRILGIYDLSDKLAGKPYDHWIEQSPNAKSFKQVELNTGVGHGFLYKPIDEWLLPTKEWILNN